jgi:hypothetical protein
MQTFLPYPDFQKSAQCLDMKRLGKQRVETLQLLNALCDNGGWANHPCAKMWRGYEESLIHYGLAICTEWISRGYKDTCYGKIERHLGVKPRDYRRFPYWFGDEAFHASHRSNLLRKKPEYYSRFGWTELPTLEYVWPVPKCES